MQNREQVISSIKPVFKQFAVVYKSLWGNKQDVNSQALAWINALENEEIEPSSYEPAMKSILANPRFENYPPNIMQFVKECRLLCKDDSPLRNEVEASLVKMRAFYLKSKSVDYDMTVEQWCHELEDSRVEEGLFGSAISSLLKSPEFSKFPPSLGEIIAESHRLNVDPALPSVKDAYDFSISPEGKDHPVMKMVKARIGGFRLASEKDISVRKLFADSYSKLLIQLSVGEIEIEVFDCKNDDHIQRVNVADTLSDILKNW